MNNVPSESYGLNLDEIEKKKSLYSDRFKTLFNFHRTEKTKVAHDLINMTIGNTKGKKKKIKGKFEYFSII